MRNSSKSFQDAKKLNEARSQSNPQNLKKSATKQEKIRRPSGVHLRRVAGLSTSIGRVQYSQNTVGKSVLKSRDKLASANSSLREPRARGLSAMRDGSIKVAKNHSSDKSELETKITLDHKTMPKKKTDLRKSGKTTTPISRPVSKNPHSTRAANLATEEKKSSSLDRLAQKKTNSPLKIQAPKKSISSSPKLREEKKASQLPISPPKGKAQAYGRGKISHSSLDPLEKRGKRRVCAVLMCSEPVGKRCFGYCPPHYMEFVAPNSKERLITH